MAGDNEKKDEAPRGFVRLVAPKGVTSCSWDGEEYPVEKGKVEVPVAAAAALADHGFISLSV